MRFPASILFTATLLCGQAFAENDPRFDIIQQPSPDRFSVCSNHGCDRIVEIGLPAEQWQLVRAVFTPAAKNAAEERQRIASAIGLMERLVAPLAGTGEDRGENLKGLFEGGIQLDCIDESTNADSYLKMMQADGLLRFHHVIEKKTRGFVIFGWPHSTAAIEESASGARWAVDSWFRDNGQDADVVPLAVWSDGWRPGDTLTSN